MKFSNCCIYINEPLSLEDEVSLNKIKLQYESDKQKLFPLLRPYFIQTCIFLINKIDEVKDYSEKIKIKENIFNNISSIEKGLKKDIIIPTSEIKNDIFKFRTHKVKKVPIIPALYIVAILYLQE